MNGIKSANDAGFFFPEMVVCGLMCFSPVWPSEKKRRDYKAPLRQMEIERVEQLHCRIGRVDGHIGGHVEQRLRVVEDDFQARSDEVVCSLLRARGGYREDADDDVLLAYDTGQAFVRRDFDVADASADLVGVRIEHRRDIDAVLRENRTACNRLAEPAGADQRDVVLPLRPEDLAH